ncbi:MAG: DUF1887 family protein [Clostridia bacterium]|nr:DUF1887 family protein [Clostridia bacterium]
MQTLIELYDERPLENVLGTEIFRPRKTVFVCMRDVAADTALHRRIREHMQARGIDTELIFAGTDMFSPAKVLQTLRGITAVYPDCAVDITGGTEAALFAAGLLSAEKEIPVFTYSRKQNRFFNISNAPFADEAVCDVTYSVSEILSMAGGAMREGRVDNAVLDRYTEKIPEFFSLYLNNRAKWMRFIGYMQEASQDQKLRVEARRTLTADHGARYTAPVEILQGLEKIGWIRRLRFDEDTVRFTFLDEQVRAWTRDIGSVLELYVWLVCRDSGLFSDVQLSVVAEWGPGAAKDRNAVRNEIDVMMTAGVIPYFVSCKTGEIHTEALNELDVLRDRFGGQMAKAAIVSASRANTAVRNRAFELDIQVIDLDDLRYGKLDKQLHTLVRTKKRRGTDQ